IRDALNTRHMGKVVRAFRRHPYHGRPVSQAIAAGWFHLTQTQLSRVENGPPVQDLDRLIHWAHILHIPEHLLCFALPKERAPQHEATASIIPPIAASSEDDEWYAVSELLRRTFMQGGLAALTTETVRFAYSLKQPSRAELVTMSRPGQPVTPDRIVSPDL